ncbi:MAG: rod shape-determining protein RodA [Epulopiscium sp.]|nr:rod shape-determining protein RodA [Candidatus Epulonipiscium sp.]
MKSKKQLKYFDIWIIMIMIALVIIGIIAIGSATHINNPDIKPEYFNKQIIGFSVGFILMLITAFIDYRFIGRFYPLYYIIIIGFLLAVLVIGKSVGGATRWLELGGFRIQPSEFTKIIMIIVVAKLMDRFKGHINHIGVICFILVIVGIPILLIQKQPDLSTSLVILFIVFAQFYVAKIHYGYIITGSIFGFLSLFFIWWGAVQPGQVVLRKFLKNHQVNRIMSFIDPKTYAMSGAYQTQQSIRAIGSGQLYGKGLYQGTLNQFQYLSEARTDFIFAVIGEEFGFIGCLMVIILISLLIFRCFWIAKDAPDLYGRLVVVGVAAMIFFQSFVHIGVTTGFLPNTGIPLPFISYGLSALWSNMIGIGLVLNVGMLRKKTYY